MMVTQIKVYVSDEDVRKMAGELAFKLLEDDKKVPYVPEGIDSISWCDDGYLVTIDVVC